MRIKYTYTTKSRLCFWACTGSFFYIYVLGNEHVDRNFYHASQKYFWMFDLNYEEWKRRERYRWSEYLRNWDPLISGNTGRGNMGYLSASVFDKWFYGNRKFQDPPTYDSEANQFIAMSDKVYFERTDRFTFSYFHILTWSILMVFIRCDFADHPLSPLTVY